MGGRPRIPDQFTKPRVFFDADVLFAGAVTPSEHGASLVLLKMAEIALIEAISSRQVLRECERYLGEKIPGSLPAFRLIVSRCLHIVEEPATEELERYLGLAHFEDLPILVSALRANCPWLVTINLRHYQPGHPEVQTIRPGEFLLLIRHLLTQL